MHYAIFGLYRFFIQVCRHPATVKAGILKLSRLDMTRPNRWNNSNSSGTNNEASSKKDTRLGTALGSTKRGNPFGQADEGEIKRFKTAYAPSLCECQYDFWLSESP